MFDVLHQFFKDNYDDLVKDFIDNKKPSALIDRDNKQEVINLHEAHINEMRNGFSQALSKDRLYLRPAGFIVEN